VGTPAEVKQEIEDVVSATGVDEVMITSTIHSHAERMKGYELLAGAFELAARSLT
jgi:alkanesulfonate monooxygenase SsuD/methylene tetrahydromethanopterin reductase-like flavin-dependent oxidoreductase (luciferase family)